MSEPSEERAVMDDYRAQGDTLVRLIRHGVEALRDGDGDATTARATLANLDQLTARYMGAVDRITALEAEVESLRADAIYESEQKDKWKRRATDAGGR